MGSSMIQDADAPGRVACLDLGKARVGLAVSDDLGLVAHPRPPLDGRHQPRLLQALRRLAAEEGVCRFLVGLPLEMSGGQGAAAQRAVRFAEKLVAATKVEVELVDERLSTVQAARLLRDAGVKRGAMQGRIDGASAAVLLQRWLDARSRSGEADLAPPADL